MSKHLVIKDFKTALKVIVPLAVSAALILWLFHKIDFDKVRAVIEQGIRWQYIVMMMVLTVMSHVIRGIRWGIQLRAAGVARMPVIAESVSIFGAYALNILFPFLGEAWRCVYVSHRQHCKLSTVIGTDIGDRASDGVMIGLFILLTIIVAHPEINRFLDHYAVGQALTNAFSHGWVWLGVAAGIVLLVVADRYFADTAPVAAINRSLSRVWSGFAVIFHMKGTGLYLLLTLGIWSCYFFETYVCFFAFDFTRDLITQPGYFYGLLPALVVFVFGSCSMIVPSNGGLGPWNLAVIFGLSLFSVGQNDAAAYSLVYWTMQALTLVALGIFSAFYITTTRRSLRKRAAKSVKTA